jgi:hypothetical protein
LAAVLVGFAILRIVAVAHPPKTFSDTGTYLWLDLLGRAERLWTVPLIWRLIGSDTMREITQISIGVIAWSVLAVVVHNSLEHPRVKLGAAAAVLLIGLAPQVTNWDTALLSESLSSSLLVLLCAAVLWLGRTRSPRAAVALGCSLLPWVFARQQNALIFLILLPVAFVLIWRGLARPLALKLTLGLALIALWAAVALAQDTPQTRLLLHYNATEVIQNRIGLDPGPLSYLRAHGIPLPADFASLVGQFDGAGPLLNDARLQRWIDDRFDSTYLGLLIHHPYYAVGEPLRNTPSLITDDAPESTVTRVLPRSVVHLYWGPGSTILYVWVCVAGILAAVALVRRRAVRLLPVTLLFGFSAVIGAVITYDLATTDLSRLILPVSITTRLTLLLLIAGAADALVAPTPGAQPQAQE